MNLFHPGDVIERREVLHGDLWLSSPVTVVYDDGERIAVRLDPGSQFTFPNHPFGVHPWASHSEWGGSIVLQLYRPGDLYSVWKIFEPDGTFRHWYFNFEAPVTRGPDHIGTEDYGLDLIVEPAGGRQWKDATCLHHQRIEGRISERTVLDVLAEAARVDAHVEGKPAPAFDFGGPVRVDGLPSPVDVACHSATLQWGVRCRRSTRGAAGRHQSGWLPG